MENSLVCTEEEGDKDTDTNCITNETKGDEDTGKDCLTSGATVPNRAVHNGEIVENGANSGLVKEGLSQQSESKVEGSGEGLDVKVEGSTEKEVKVEIKKEVEDETFSAAFLCDVKLSDDCKVKDETPFDLDGYQGHVIKDEPEEEDDSPGRKVRKRKRISYAEDPDVVFIKSQPEVPRQPQQKRKRKKFDYDDDCDVVLVKDGIRLRPVRKVKVKEECMEEDEEKEFSEDVNDMCNCQCKICDKVFVHHRMIKHIERTHKQGSKDKFTFLKLSYYRCKICRVEILFSYYNIGQHVKRCHQMSLQDYKDSVQDAFTGDIVLEPEPENTSEPREYTDDLSEMCQCKCNFCDKVFFYHQLRPHVLKEHKETMEKQWKIEFTKRTYYKCKICDEGMLFHYDTINRHLYTHKVTLKDYKSQHQAFSGHEIYKRVQRAAEKIKRRRKYEFDAACVQKWSCTVTGTRKFYSDNLDEMCLRRCRLCDEVMMHDALKYHLTNDHKEYEGNATNMDFVRLTYHRCKICEKDIVFTYNSVSKHTKRWHKINFKDYSSTYNAFNELLCDLTLRPEDSMADLQTLAKIKPIARKSVPKTVLKSVPKMILETQTVANCVPKAEPDTPAPHTNFTSFAYHSPESGDVTVKHPAAVYNSMVALQHGQRQQTPHDVIIKQDVSHAENLHTVNNELERQKVESLQFHNYDHFGKMQPEGGWYDGNTFQCLQCGFMSRSIHNFETHVKSYHHVSLAEFSPYIAKTNLLYRCQFCLQEVYHEKSSIMNHLAFHNLDIESYANIYERPRTLY